MSRHGLRPRQEAAASVVIHGMQQRAQFDALVSQLSLETARRSSGAKGLLPQLAELWKKSELAKEAESWDTFRGIHGETCLHWLAFQKAIHNVAGVAGNVREDILELLEAVMLEIIQDFTELLKVQCTAQPYKGETAFQVLVANSEEVIFNKAMEVISQLPNGRDFVNVCVNCDFFQDMFGPGPEIEKLCNVGGITVLDCALLLPLEDAVSLRMLTALVRAGAEPVTYKKDGRFNGSFLHRLAKSRWSAEEDRKSGMGGHITQERLEAVIDLFCDGVAFHAVNKDSRDVKGRTAHEVAAVMGNRAMVVHLLKKRAIPIWQYGSKSESAIPLTYIDSGSYERPDLPLLEVMVVHRRYHMLTLGICDDLIWDKWRKYGRQACIIQMCMMLTLLALVTISCLGETSVSVVVKSRCRMAAISIASCFTTYRTAGLVMGRKCGWYKAMSWFSKSRRVGFFEPGPNVDLLVTVLAGVVLMLQECEHVGVYCAQMSVYLDAASSFIMLLLWADMLRFLKMHETFGVMITALPHIMFANVLPWSIVYVILVLGFAGAIRIAAKSHTDSSNPSDQILGNFHLTAMTLEEATHGPDVQWRKFVMEEPTFVAVLFVSFLWIVTIIMLNLLISMFSDTYEYLRSEAWPLITHYRAMEIISHEKLMPIWMRECLNIEHGAPRGTHAWRGRTPETSKNDLNRGMAGSQESLTYLNFSQDIAKGESMPLNERYLFVTGTAWHTYVDHPVQAGVSIV